MSKVYWFAMIVLGGGLVLLVLSDSTGSVMGIDNDDFGRLVTGAALVSVLSAGIFSSRHRLGETARMLGLWAVIILALVAGYQYRYELQDVASRVTGGLIVGSPLSITDAEGRTSVMLEKRPNGHFEARMTVNGATISAMVDTGATSTVLTAADAVRAGFDLQALNFNIPVSTANGTTTTARVVADEVGVGAILRRDLPIMVARDGLLEQSLLGMNFMGSLSGYDVRGDRLILRD